MEEIKKKTYWKLRDILSIKRIAKMLLIILFIYIYTFVNAIQDFEPTQVSDRIVEALYFKGKKIYKISYDDLEDRTNEFNMNSVNEKAKNYRTQNSTLINNQNIKSATSKNFFFFLSDEGLDKKNSHLFKAVPFYYLTKDYVKKDLFGKHSDNSTTQKINLNSLNLLFDFESINSHDTIGLDLYQEVIEEQLNSINNTNDKNNFLFDFNLKSLYGNDTKLKLRNWDLVKLVENNVMSNDQAYKFWLELIKINKNNINPEFIKKSFSYISKAIYSLFFEKFYRVNRIKNNHGYNYNSVNDAEMRNYNPYTFSDIYSDENQEDVYIFNIFPTKSTGCWIFAFILFIINYNLINFYNNKDKSSPIINFALVIFSLIMTENFYSWKIYFTSSIFFVQFIYSFKFFIFSILFLFGYKTEDFDIFSEFSKTNDSIQIILQGGTLFICTAVYGIFSFYRYNYIINYFFFYYCLLQLPSIFSINFYHLVPFLFQPFRYFLILCIGFFNYLFINYGSNKMYHTNNPNNQLFSDLQVDSFYIVGDLFTIFCLTYAFDYLFIQSNNISILFQESEHGGYINKDKLNDKITHIIKNYKELIREFELEDCIWMLCFNIGFFMQYTGLKFHKYLLYYFSYYYFRMVLGVYGRIFTIKCLKMTYSMLILALLISNFIMSSRVDSKLFEALKLTNSDLTNLLRIFCRFFGVINIIALILLNHEYLSIEIYSIFFCKEPEMIDSEESEDNDEESEAYISELLKDENFDNFLKECKNKFKNNLKSLYSMLNGDRENNQSINENELGEDDQNEDRKYFPEEIDELIEERIKDKYFKNLAKYLIRSKLNKKKKKNRNSSNEDMENSVEEEENSEENEEDDEEANKKKNEKENENEDIENIDEKEIQMTADAIKSFFVNSLYCFVETALTYFTICLLLLFIFHLEQNIFIIWCYYALLIILLIRLLIVSEQHAHTFEFLFKYTITFIIGMRLQTLTKNSLMLYIIVCSFIYLLVNMYTFNEKRRFYLTIILVIFCYSTTFRMYSLFNFILIIVFIVCSSITWNSKILKFGISSILVIIPLLILYLTEKYDKQGSLDKFDEKVVSKIINFNENYLSIFGFNFLKYIQDTVHNQNFYEYEILKYLLNYLIKLNL